MDTKICIQCELEKPKDDFGNVKKSPDGKSSYCKNCLKANYKKSKMNNPIRVRAKQMRNHMVEKTNNVYVSSIIQ